MPTEGICLQLTHVGTGQILLADVHDGMDALNGRVVARKPGPVYLNPGDVATLVYTSQVALSYETGNIRAYIDNGTFTDAFVLGAAFLAAGSITGTHPALESPTTLQDLVTFMETTTRPVGDTGTAGAIIYADSGTGSDVAGDGTVGAPVASLGKALQLAASSPILIRSIRLVGAGPYSFSGLVVNEVNFITFVGDDPLVLDSRTITGVGISSRANGLILTDADAAMGVDAYRGNLVQFTSGTLNGQYGVIYRNAANQIEVTQDTQGATFKIPIIGNTYDILDWVTVIDFPLGLTYILESWGGSGFRHIKFAQSNRFLFCNDTDKLDFTRCRFEIDSLLAGRGGSLYLNCCSVANRGSTFGGWGMVTSITQGIITLKNGTFIDAVLAPSAARARITGVVEGFYETHGDIVFRDLGADAVLIMASGIGTTRARLGNIFSHWRFIDCVTALNVNTGDEGGGWAPCDVPDLFGNVTGNYAVDARLSANVRIGSASNILTATVPNAVTVDGVTASCQDEFLTLIRGGTPAASGFAARFTQSFVTADLVGDALTVTHNLGKQFVQIAVYDDSNVLTAITTVTLTSAWVATLDFTGMTPLAGTWNVVVTG